MYYSLWFLLLSWMCVTPSETLHVHVNEVYDGDTFFVDIPDVPDVFGKRIGVRILGVDCPELRTKNKQEKKLAIQAKEYTTCQLLDVQVELRNVQRDKYFRLVADVYVCDMNFAEELIEAGLAKRYDGGTKEGWK